MISFYKLFSIYKCIIKWRFSVGNYTRMLRAILNKSWQQHPTRHQLYGHLPPITKTIQVRRTRHAGHCWRSRDELIRDVLLWIPTHGRAKAGRPARTYIQQLCEDTWCCPEDLPRAMNDREEWRERVRDIRATSAIWWWWYSLVYYMCDCLINCRGNKIFFTTMISRHSYKTKNFFLFFFSLIISYNSCKIKQEFQNSSLQYYNGSLFRTKSTILNSMQSYSVTCAR